MTDTKQTTEDGAVIRVALAVLLQTHHGSFIRRNEFVEHSEDVRWLIGWQNALSNELNNCS